MKHRLFKALPCLCLSFGCALLPCRQAESGSPVIQPHRLAGKAIIVSSHATILVGKAALPLFKQCSRGAPDHVSGYWTPSLSDVQHLERDALAFLKAQKPPVRGLMVSDCRQYAGFLRHGRRMIYVNGFPAAVTLNYPVSGRNRWQWEAVVICDGGPSLYGMEYDPQTRRFEHLEFNGEA